VKVSATRWTPIYKEELMYNQIGMPVLSVASKGSGSLTEYFRTEWDYNNDGWLATETLTGPMQRMPGFMVKKKLMVIRSFDDEGDLSREMSMHHVEISLDISGLPHGAYLIHVSENGHPLLKTLLIRE